MFMEIADKQPNSSVKIVEHLNRTDEDDAIQQKAELRRKMYERIAQGNALAEIEENAQGKWHTV